MENLLIKHFERVYSSNRIAHAFLICDTFYDVIKNDLEYVLSNYFFDGNTNLSNNSDMYYIKPNDGKIVKDDILNLQEVFKTKSLTNKNRVYIIDEAEKMNLYAANSLLKFLEEPEENIYAILITSNVNKILPTIKSRCQILMIDNKCDFNIETISKEQIESACDIVYKFETKGYDGLPFIYEKLSKKIEKEDLKILIKIVKYLYRDCLNYIFYETTQYFSDYIDLILKIVSNNSEESLVNKMYILLKEENKLIYNLNTNLFLDNLLIEMEEVNYE